LRAAIPAFDNGGMVWKQATRPRSGNTNSPALFVWALTALIFAVYVPVLRNGLTVFDMAPAARDLAAGVRGPFDIPLPVHLAPAWLHLSAVALHALASVLVYFAGRRLTGDAMAGLIAGVFFAVHPAHVDAVARIRAIPELAASVCMLAGIVGILRAGPPLWARNAVLAGTGLAWNVLTLALSRAEIPGSMFLQNPLIDATYGTRLMTAVHIFGRYLLLTLWPYRLSPDYSLNSVPVVSDPLSRAFLVPAVAAALLAAAVILLARWHGTYRFAAVFFLLSAFPVWNVFDPRLPIMAERFTYLPSAAVCWAASALFRDAGWLARPDWRDRRSVKSLALIAICIVIPWSTKTFMRAGQWRDEKVLLQSAMRTVPDNAQIQLLLGNLHLREGNVAGAQRSYRRALGLYPEFAAAAVHLGAAYRRTGQYLDALAVLEKASPESATLRAERCAELGRVYFARNEYTAAADAFEKAIGLEDTDASVQLELGTLYTQFLSQPDRGRQHLRRSLDLDLEQSRAQKLRNLLAR
jgi:protein O-mannosyl-transferase